MSTTADRWLRNPYLVDFEGIWRNENLYKHIYRDFDEKILEAQLHKKAVYHLGILFNRKENA
jgi:hypothetical protein